MRIVVRAQKKPGEKLDINKIPFIDNAKAVEIAERTNNRPPPLTLTTEEESGH